MAHRFYSLLSLSAALVLTSITQADEAFVPGTGVKVTMVGDDFEDPSWSYVMNGQKASFEQDEQQRPPGGGSRNKRWFESAMRGQPDVVKRVSTPPGGLPDSKGALLMRTRLSGIPGELSGKQMQDDLLMGVSTRLGNHVPVSWHPSCTVRVYLPPFEQWENRSGASFGVRADLLGRNREGKVEPYWPGFFILFRSETSKQFDRDFAQISFRAQPTGQDLAGSEIHEPGWWTFGMSFTPDGQIHYYAHAGVDDLNDDDHLYSSFAYGWQALRFDNFFLNVANWDNGQTWSTPWVIDDPAFYVIPPEGQTVANLVRKRSGSSPQGGISSAMKTFRNRLMK
jgi:hypothetical protein